MCGIFGFFIKDATAYQDNFIGQVVEDLFLLSETRGKEASGIAIRTGKGKHVVKSPMRASQFIKTAEYANTLAAALGERASGDGAKTFTILGHSRLVTNGSEENAGNNQPVSYGQVVGIHNGIIVNDRYLWEKYPHLTRTSEVDTEVIMALISSFADEMPLGDAAVKAFEELEGEASIAAFTASANKVVLASNTEIGRAHV
jgi:glucosamine 6-phosphate synthetase-like amidotransferase/phosphosugar isomerase protein